eukprot:2422233-Rhodomonas_salina.2
MGNREKGKEMDGKGAGGGIRMEGEKVGWMEEEKRKEKKAGKRCRKQIKKKKKKKKAGKRTEGLKVRRCQPAGSWAHHTLCQYRTVRYASTAHCTPVRYVSTEPIRYESTAQYATPVQHTAHPCAMSVPHTAHPYAMSVPSPYAMTVPHTA